MVLMPKSPLERGNFRGIFKGTDFSGKTALIISSWFFSGLIPKAPGTFGTLAAVPLLLITNCLGPIRAGVFLIVIISLGIWASEASRNLLERDDPSEVVIDEVAGFLVTMFLLPLSLASIIAGFFLFRIFDILKPFPVGFVDKKVKGGAGIVLDDILAGIYANICVRMILYFFGR